MRTAAALLALAASLAWAPASLAGCTLERITTQDGRVIVCQTCCTGDTCFTNCF